MSRTITTKEVPTFVRPSHELSKMAKLLAKGTKECIDVLNKGVQSDDLKIATACAKDLLQLEVQVANMIAADNLQRLVAENRYGNGKTTNLVTDETNRNIPRVDFNTIISV